jgi:hypothetical protein
LEGRSLPAASFHLIGEQARARGDLGLAARAFERAVQLESAAHK